MSPSQLLDVTTLSRGFPDEPESKVSRDNLIEAIEGILEGNTDVVLIEGNEGIGKTNLVADFARRHARDSIALFLRATSKVGYSQGYVRLMLAEQIAMARGKYPLAEDHQIDDGYLHTSYFVLQRKLERENRQLFFVIDGLTNIPDEDRQVAIPLVLDMLPIGLPGYKFVITGYEELFSPKARKSIRIKPYTIAPFSPEETKQYLSDLNLTGGQIQESHKLCRGVPGRLAVIRRLIRSGTTIDRVLTSDLTNMLAFLLVEWQQVPMSEDHKRILAFACFGLQDFTVSDLASLTGIAPMQLSKLISAIPFLRSAENEHTVVEFVSDAHRRFAAAELSSLRTAVLDLLISYARQDISSPSAMQALPTYLLDAGRHHELLSLLTPAYLTNVLTKGWSLGPVARLADLGLQISEREKVFPHSIQFSLIRSFLRGFTRMDVLRLELEALLALDEIEVALALANSCVLKEDRLQLYALIAKSREERKLPRDLEISRHLSVLCQQIDVEALGDRAIAIASDLMHSEPTLALEFVERAAGTIGDPNGLDGAFAQIAINAMGLERHNKEHEETLRQLREKIRDPEIQSFSEAVSVLFSDFSAREVIQKVNQLKPSHRLFLLRNWATENRERSDAAEVVSYSLELLISQPGTSPKAKDLREIATPLPYLVEHADARDIVRRIDALKGALAGRGTTEEFIRLELILARTQAKYDLEGAQLRALSLYYEIEAIADLSTRTACFAWLLGSLASIDKDSALDKRLNLTAEIQKQLDVALHNLFESSADHFKVAKGTIAAFARRNPKLGVEICKRLNTEHRRNEAYKFLIREISSVKSQLVSNVDVVLSLPCQISDTYTRDDSIVHICQRLSTLDEQNLSRIAGAIPLVLQEIRRQSYCSMKCVAAAYFYTAVLKLPYTSSRNLSVEIKSDLDKAWESMDSGWPRIQTALRVARIIGKQDEEYARAYLEKARGHRREVYFDSRAVEKQYFFLLELAGRALASTLRVGFDVDSATKRFADLVERLSTIAARSQLWSTIAQRAFASGKNDFAKRIVDTYLRPCLATLAASDSGTHNEILVDVAPALYKAHILTGIEAVKTLPRVECNTAITAIVQVLLRKTPLLEPYAHNSGEKHSIESYEEITEILKVLNEASTDAVIYGTIRDLADTITHKSMRDRVFKTQKASLSEEMLRLTTNKLPDKFNIAHDGFLIACEIQILRIFGESPSKWKALHDRAKRISNLADRAYVLTSLASCRPYKPDSNMNEAIEEIFSIIESIPSDFDRLDRYELIADLLAYKSPKHARTAIQNAMKLASTMSYEADLYKTQSRLLDLAHKLDPKFADTLADAIDDDPARKQFKEKAEERLKFLGVKQQMADNTLNEVPSSIDSDEYAAAAWMNLSNLNAGRLALRKDADYIASLRVGASNTVTDAYPVFALAVSNSCRRLTPGSKKDPAGHELLDALLNVVEFASKISAETIERRSWEGPEVLDDNLSEGKVFEAGQRPEALRFLQEWFGAAKPRTLILCDPYFALEDLEILRLVQSVVPKTRIVVLADRNHISRDGSALSDDVFLNYWRQKLSDQRPPETELVLIAVDDVPFPIHDRWIICERSGLHFGTSFSSIGIARLSEISEMGQAETISVLEKLRPFLERSKKEHLGHRVRYTVLSM